MFVLFYINKFLSFYTGFDLEKNKIHKSIFKGLYISISQKDIKGEKFYVSFHHQFVGI